MVYLVFSMRISSYWHVSPRNSLFIGYKTFYSLDNEDYFF